MTKKLLQLVCSKFSKKWIMYINYFVFMNIVFSLQFLKHKHVSFPIIGPIYFLVLYGVFIHLHCGLGQQVRFRDKETRQSHNNVKYSFNIASKILKLDQTQQALSTCGNKIKNNNKIPITFQFSPHSAPTPPHNTNVLFIPIFDPIIFS